nr:hypothetical protein [Oscillochloris trichoides]
MSDRTDTNKQEILYKVVDNLQRYGNAYLEQITSRLTTHSTGGTADLVFIPSSGPYAGTVHVCEFKRSSSSMLPSVVTSNAIQHSQWIRELNPETNIRLALVSNAVVEAPIVKSVEFTTFSGIKNPQELTNKIITWSGLSGSRSINTE